MQVCATTRLIGGGAQVDENMKAAHWRDSARSAQFYFRDHVLPFGAPGRLHTNLLG